MTFKVLNRVPLQDAHRPSQIKETTVTIQDQSPFTQYTRTLDGDWTKDTDNAVINAVLEQVFKDTFAGRYESEKVTNLENRVLTANEAQQATERKVTTLEQTLTKEVEKVNKLVETIIHAEDLTQAQKELILAQHPVYEIGRHYNVDDVINYDGKLYEIVQEHVSQGDWKPDETPALYTPIRNTEYEDEEGNEVKVINDYIQPQGAHDAYQTGDKVRFNDQVYESVKDDNAHSPDDYPQGWKLVKDEEESQPEDDEPEAITENVPEFIQPTGAHDAYQTGDKVMFNGQTYESTMDNNNYSPKDYPVGWRELAS